MKFIVACGAIACLAISLATNPADSQRVYSPTSIHEHEPELVPNEFRGNWAAVNDTCNGSTQMVVSAQTVDTKDAGGRVLQVAPGKTPLSLVILIGFEGDGDLWQSKQRWTLAKSGNILVIDNDEGFVSMKRC